MNRRMLTVGMVFGLALGAGVALAGEQGEKQDGAAAVPALPNCVVMSEPVNLAVSVATDDGPVYFCCKGCVKKYNAQPDKYSAKVADQRKALADRPKVQVTCPLSGDPVDQKVFVEHDGQNVYFCCKDCVSKFQADPGKYKVALANGYTFQTKCPVMGGEIDPKSFGVLSTGETIYYCCQKCDRSLRSEPQKYNQNLVAQGIQIDWAKVKASGHDDHDGHDHPH